MKRFLRGQRGFTLMELMVVVAILGVLTAIVVPAISGTKDVSVEGQVTSDAREVQTALTTFNNRSIKSRQFPEFSVATVAGATSGSTSLLRYRDTASVGGVSNGAKVILVGKDKATSLGTLASTITMSGTTTAVDARRIIDFEAKTDVYDTDGSVKVVTLVPDFLLKFPGSLDLRADETKALGSGGNTLREFLWVSKITAPGSDSESRTVEVYRLTQAKCVVNAGDALETPEASKCGGISSLSQVKELTYTQVF